MRIVGVLITLLSCAACAQNFTEFPRAQQVVDELVEEHGLERELVESWMADGVVRKTSVQKLAAPAEQTKTYAEYKPMFVSRDTILNGKRFMEHNALLLEKAEQIYGVPTEIIAAIIGVESRYGLSKGRHNTFNALGTLAVTEGRRADYFQREWTRFILIAVEQGFNPVEMKGSYAGATGYPQFMPTSYIAYAVDHDEDGDINIWNDPYDAIGSVANYLKENGWVPGAPIVSDVTVTGDFEQVKVNSFERDRTLQGVMAKGWNPEIKEDASSLVFPVRLDGEDGAEYWLGYKNFWVISRYNRSTAYSMAVFHLAQEIANHEGSD